MNLDNIDIVYITHNSDEWIDRCFEAYSQSLFPSEKINILIVDIGSSDSSLKKLETVKDKYSFASISILKKENGAGTGKAYNTAFAKGKSDIVCFFSIKTEIYPNTLTNLIDEIINTKNEKSVVWELMQYPYEHPKRYDILTGETEWISGDSFAITREAFKTIGGFDETISMYAEDVDLSFRLRSADYLLKYCPKAGIINNAYKNSDETKQKQYINSIATNLLLRWRFGDRKDISNGYVLYKSLLKEELPFGCSKAAIKAAYRIHFFKIPHYVKWRLRKDNSTAGFSFYDWEYEKRRLGDSYYQARPDQKPLVSVLTRTCGRPNVLRETLVSLRRQTYDNIEIIIVEDGEPITQKMIENEFSDLRIVYSATGEKVGRSIAGNIAMEKSGGKYLNFLDDDDLLYADHIETLVAAIEGSDYRAAYAVAEESSIIVNSTEPYSYDVVNTYVRYMVGFDRSKLYVNNIIPIQAIMFERTFFEKLGGFDCTLDLLEDWDLWVRYASDDDFLFVEKSTSIYRVPNKKDVYDERHKRFEAAYDMCVNGFDKYIYNSSKVSDLSRSFAKLNEADMGHKE